MFYDQLKRLCDKKGVSPTKVTIECGADRSGVTYWKKTGAIPNQKVLNNMANYFDVSIDYLLGKEEKEKPVTDDELNSELLLEFLSLSNEEQEKLLTIMKNHEKLQALLSLL